MRLIFMIETYTKNMGYLENILPKYLARLGLDVHIITTDLNAYHYLKDFQGIYGKFVNDLSHCTANIEKIDDCTIHRIPYYHLLGHVQMKGWFQKLKSLSPQIVQTTNPIGWIQLDAAIAKPLLGYKLFTGSHRSASTFDLFNRSKRNWTKEELNLFFTRTIPGRIGSSAVEKCYCPTSDSAEIAWKFYGIEKHKVEVMFLGVDTDYFYPVGDSKILYEERIQLRKDIGFQDDEIVCVYSGKMTETKNPLIIAQAIERLRAKGKKFSCLFIGNGSQRDTIARYQFCHVLDFMPHNKLAAFYRASDIGVWPTNESISMLDAAACGLPLIVSDGIVYRDHVCGNGLIYPINNLEKLVDTLIQLSSSQYRSDLGHMGSQKMKMNFNWGTIAKNRLQDYEESLAKSTH
jgi:glycosyltransferase involved in cell wall biosynthesis